MKEDETAFLEWLAHWEENLPPLALEEVVGSPDRVAIISQDMVKGFCTEGALSSDRAAAIVPAVVDLFRRAHDLGVGHLLLLQDTHDADAVEFAAFPPHCVAGSSESETIAELDELEFANLFTVIPKNSVSSDVGTAFAAWLDKHPQVTTFIVVGVCSDICVYQAAMYLRVRANVLRQHQARIIVPADCVQTYDMPPDVAAQVGALPHNGDLLHRIFLYHLALNGVEVVAHLD